MIYVEIILTTDGTQTKEASQETDPAQDYSDPLYTEPPLRRWAPPTRPRQREWLEFWVLMILGKT